MDRTRASSLESHKNLCDKYDSFSPINPTKIYRRNRLHSLVGSARECSDESASLDYFCKRDYQRPLAASSDLKEQFDVLQCTVNRMLNGGAFDDLSSAAPSVNLSEALKHEYRQMMSALKDLESILGCKRRNNDSLNFSTSACTNDIEIHQLQKEIYFRDSLIKCLSDRLKVLCKANDKLIIDYENQENILSEELICLKRQLEKAKEALRSLSMMKSRSNISVIQDIENEAYFLRESVRTKEKMISDLKYRLDKSNRENAELKCELENKDVMGSRFGSNRIDRELSYTHHVNEQLQTEIDSLKTKLECKNELIDELQKKLDLTGFGGLSESVMISKLREELLIANEENEMTKEAILEQSDMLEDFKSQIKILSENNDFKDETISELRCCIRKLTECQTSSIPIKDVTPKKITDERGSQSLDLKTITLKKNTDERGSQSLEIKTNDIINLLNSIKRYINQNQPDLLKLLDSQTEPYNSLEKFAIELMKMKNKVADNHEDIELFKEHLTNEINLKNTIIKFLTNNLTEDIESLEKLQSQMNNILSFDMDRKFKTDLKDYLHQCFLLDDNLKSVVEYLVKRINEISAKQKTLSSENISLIEKLAIYVPTKFRDKQSIDTNSRMTTSYTNTQEPPRSPSSGNQDSKIQQLEEELKILNISYQQDKQRFNSEMGIKNQKIDSLNQKLMDFQKLVDEKSKLDSEFKKLSSDYKDTLNKSKDCLLENDRLKGEIEILLMKNKQIDRNLNLKNSEIENMEVTMRRVSDQFVNMSSTQENVKKSIEAIKDAEIDRLNKEIENLKLLKKSSDELKQANNGHLQKITALTKEIQGLETQNSDLKKLLNTLQKDLDKVNAEKMNLFDSIAQLKIEKNKEINELKASLEPKMSLQLKSIQTDPNHELAEMIDKLRKENEQLSKQLKQEELESGQLRASMNTLKIENKSIEIKNNSITSDKGALEAQIKQLRDKINEINRNCDENHVSKSLMKSQNEQSELYKSKVVDLEGILACLTDELNEKVQLVEDLRRNVKNNETCKTPCKEPSAISVDSTDFSKQIILQKDSEIAYLKSKLESTEKSAKLSLSKYPSSEKLSVSPTEVQNLRSTIADMERRINQLSQQLTERSENIAQLQKLLKEKDEIIENSNKIIKAKSTSVGEMEKMVHLMSLENTNIKDELSSRLEDESQLKLLQSKVGNLSEEIVKLRSENDKCRAELNKLNLEKINRVDSFAPLNIKSQSSDVTSRRTFIQQPSNLPDSSVQQINNEIQKLYFDFEGKSNEIKEYSLKEIKSRDKKIDEINLELKLKSDQFTTIMVENRRLLDKLENESQKSSQYEQNLMLKEQLLDKLAKEKEKIRATFITELRSKSEELDEKTKTVYFLNAELHRLASEIEVLNSELHVVKVSDKYQPQSKQIIEINQVTLDNLKSENNSLKLCLNLKLAEMESMKNEITIKQIHNDKLREEVDFYNSKSKELEASVEATRRESLKTESDMQKSIHSLTKQLKDVEEGYRNVSLSKSNMESVVRDLENENLTLKLSKESIEKEKMNYVGEIGELRSKISTLSNSLAESKNQIVRKAMKNENDQQEMRRLSDTVLSNEKSLMNQTKTLNQALQQIEELTEENNKYKTELEKMSNRFYELEEEYRLLSGKFGKTNEDLKSKENELVKFKELENQLNSGLKRKSSDCEKLKQDYDELLVQCEHYQFRLEQLENQEKNAFRSLEQKNSQCSYIQENLEHVRKQLFMTEDKFKTCNSQWLEKYGQLKNNYERMECDYLQIQNQLDTINQDRGALETTINNLNSKINSLTENYRKLNDENAHLRRENCFNVAEFNRLQNCNVELTAQIESMSREILAAHTEICELTVRLRESQSNINEMSCKNLSPIRHYGSHPVLNQANICHPDSNNFEQKDYCDLRTRYSALCGQIDNLTCQMKKKDKRITDLQKEFDMLCHKMSTYEQIQCDYQELDYKYQQLKDDFNNLSQYYQNINYSHNPRNVKTQESIIQVCTDELQETINCLTQEIKGLKLSLQTQQNEYQTCCGKMRQLEEQIQLDHMELEKWNQAYYSSENNYGELTSKYDQLKYVYDEAIIQLDHINELKQDLVDKSNRILEISNINENIEQQILQAHQQINSQNEIIENYKMKMHNLEMCYEQELEQARHEIMILKNNERSHMYSELNEKINCLKEKNRILECELLESQNQYHIQVSTFSELRNEQEKHLMQTEELRQEYDDQCSNINKLAGQLFDKNELIEQLTSENHHLQTENECHRQKCLLLTEQIDCLNQCLIDKNNELIMTQTNLEVAEENGMLKDRETIDLSNHVEYLTEQIEQRNNELEEFQKELLMACDSIEEMKRQQRDLCGELETLNRVISEKDQTIFNKNEMLTQYSKELEMNYEQKKAQCIDAHTKSGVSVQEYCEMKLLNEKLNNEIEFLKNKLGLTSKTSETQTQRDQKISETNRVNYLSHTPSPVSDLRPYNEDDQSDKKESEKSAVSEVTYSSTKSVAWKTTHTDEPKNVGTGVLELQKAIDEYNTLVTNIEMSEAVINSSLDNQSIQRPQKIYSGVQGKTSPDHPRSINQKIDIDFQNADEVDVIVVDVDSMGKSNRTSNILNIANEQSVTHVSQMDDGTFLAQPDLKDVIDMLRNCNITVDFDEEKEPFETYFQRMMLKYNELEQFYLASMKINIDSPQDPSNFKTIEMFSDLYEKSQQNLIQHCQLLKSSMSYNTLEVNDNIQPTNEQKLTSEEMMNMVNFISTKQLQLSALNLTHKNLQQISAMSIAKPKNITPLRLNQEYQQIWATSDVCNPNIILPSTKVRQLSLQNRMFIPSQSKTTASTINSMKSPLENLKMHQGSKSTFSKASMHSEDPKLRTGSIRSVDVGLETVISKSYIKSVDSVSHSTEKDNKGLVSQRSLSITGAPVTKNDSKSINFGKLSDLNNISESVKGQILQEKEMRLNPSIVTSSGGSKGVGPKFQQQFYEGVSQSESKTQSLRNLEDAIGYATIGQFEKEMHQLNNIDFDNFDSSINIKDRVRIYAAEIDYLNEKNLFHTYAINTLTNPSRYPQNSNFIDQISASLTAKAEFIKRLQSEFKFDPHLSKKEKEIINKVLDPKSGFTFKKLFESWVNEMKSLEKHESNTSLMNKINELSRQLEICRSQLNSLDKPNADKKVESLLTENKCLTNQLNDALKNIDKLSKDFNNLKSKSNDFTVEKLTRENENLKDLLKSSQDRGQTSTLQLSTIPSSDKIKQSKIPLFRGSTMEGQPSNADRKTNKWEDVNRRALADMTNVTKSLSNIADSLGPFKHTNGNTNDLIKASNDVKTATGKVTQAISNVKPGADGAFRSTQGSDDKALLQSAGKLVSPEEVKMAISKEMSLENLKQFASLLAEDNFDLAAEIEKLLITIEELRRQLKENCEILSETVDMLQNSENFVNQLEKKLNIETKKTQVITTRIDKLNELNGKVILELERILKQPSSVTAGDMTSQEGYDYLFMCLKKIEAENLNLQAQKDKLENDLSMLKTNNPLNFLGPNLSGPIDFEFETVLMPSGIIEGTINMLNNDETAKKLALSFDVHMKKEDVYSDINVDSKDLGHFMIQQEPHYSQIKRSLFTAKSKPKSEDNTYSNNNNCCYGDLSVRVSMSVVDVHCLQQSFDGLHRLSVGCTNKNSSYHKNHNLEINKIHSKSSSITFFRIKNNFDYQMQSPHPESYKLHYQQTNINLDSFVVLESSTSPLYQLQTEMFHCQRYVSLASISSSDIKSAPFINYRKPIHFRRICDHP